MSDLLQSLIEARARLRAADTRPYGNKTVLVIHPAMRQHLDRFKSDDPYQGMMSIIGGMRVYEHLHMFDDNGEIVPLEQDHMYYVHEKSLWCFAVADFAKKFGAEEDKQG